MTKIQTAAFGVPEYEMKWEGTYRPRVSPDHLLSLWRLKQRTGKSITKLVAEAIDEYLKNRKGVRSNEQKSEDDQL